MKIFFVNGKKAGNSVEFAQSVITIGREDDNLLPLDTDGTSRYHGRIYADGNQFMVEDLGSTNGVKLNTVKITKPSPIHEGDLLEFGEQMIRVTNFAVAKSKVVFNKSPQIKAEPKDEPAPPPKPAPPAEPQKATKVVDLTGNIFGKYNKNSVSKPENEQGNGKRKLLSNRLFYTILICAAVVAVAMFYKMVSEEKKDTTQSAKVEERVTDFLLFYEKEQIKPDNVFRFALQIENGVAVFTVDDLKSNRNFEKKYEDLTTEDLELFRSRLERSGFLVSTAPPAGNQEIKNQEIRRLVVGTRTSLNDVTVVNNTAPQPFSDMEDAIQSFAENYGLQTISQTPEELKNEAERSFRKAEDLFANYAAEATNLRNAILRYKITVDSLEQFSPKPTLCIQAENQLKKATAMREQRLKDLTLEAARLLKFQEFEKLRYIYLQQMDLSDLNSKEYQKVRSRLFKLDSYLNKVKK